MFIGQSLSITQPRLFGAGGPVDPDPVPGFLFHYKLDGTDSALTPTGTPDYRIAPECEEAIGSWFGGTLQSYDSSDLALTAVGTGAYSISFWMNSNVMSNKAIVSTGAGITNNQFRIRHGSSGQIQIRIDNDNVVSTASLNDGVWHHITITSTGANGVSLIYVDGVLDKTDVSQNYNLDGSGLLEIGVSNGTQQFEGGLDGVRFYDRALSAPEISTLYGYRCDFNPEQITTSAWLDAQSLPTITQVGGAVSQWDDKSGNANNLTQGTGSQQPTLSTINGLVALDGDDATGKHMDLTSPIVLSDYSFFAVLDNDLEPGSAGSTSQTVMGTSSTNDSYIASFRISSGPVLDVRSEDDGGASEIRTTSSITTTLNPFIFSQTGETAVSYESYFNGVLGDGTGVLSDDITVNEVWGGYGFGDRWDGKIGELIIVPSALSAEDRQRVEGYLAWKWGIQASLPAGHPYEDSPPLAEGGGPSTAWNDNDNWNDGDNWTE